MPIFWAALYKLTSGLDHRTTLRSTRIIMCDALALYDYISVYGGLVFCVY